MSRRHDSQDRAVSPVIGSVLLIAITVIVMATLGAQVLSGGVYEEQPNAELVFDEDGTNLIIGVERATGLVGSETTVRVQEADEVLDWVVEGNSGEIEAGDTVSFSDGQFSGELEKGRTIQVISSNTLIDEYELKKDY